MERLFRALKGDRSYREVLSLAESRKSALVYGASGSAKHALIASVYREDPRMMLVVTSAGEGLRQMADDLGALLPEVQVEVLPAADLIMADGLTKNSTLMAKRQAVFSAKHHRRRCSLAKPSPTVGSSFVKAISSSARSSPNCSSKQAMSTARVSKVQASSACAAVSLMCIRHIGRTRTVSNFLTMR